jgi:hypothetical protein
VVQAFTYSTQEVEAGGLQVQDQPGLHSKTNKLRKKKVKLDRVGAPSLLHTPQALRALSYFWMHE